MATRRNRGSRMDAFGGQDDSLAAVDGALFGGLEVADRQRVITRPVRLDEIRVDQAIQVRAALVEARVLLLVEVLLNGGEFKDAIELCKDDEDRLWLADGFHRIEAYMRALADPRVIEGEIEIAPLRGTIYPGGRDGAISRSEDANLKHGEPLTNQDKKNILWRRLERRHGWVQESARKIAADLGISHTTVSLWRHEFLSTGNQLPVRDNQPKKKAPKSQIIETVDGRVIDVGKIVKANTKRAKRGPTLAQKRSLIIRHLRDVGKLLLEVEKEVEAQQVGDFADELTKEWEMG